MIENIIAWDLETECFDPGYMAPKPVCLSWCTDSTKFPHHALLDTHCALNGGDPNKYNVGLATTDRLESAAASVLVNTSVGYNIAYDLACLVVQTPLLHHVLHALEHNKIVCALILERLGEIYRGDGRGPLNLSFVSQKYGLPALEGKHIDNDNDQEDIQTTYGPLLYAPLSAYSPQQVRYAALDAQQLLRLFRRQETRWLESGKIYWSDLAELTRRSFWLQMAMVRGLRTDPYSIADLFAVTNAEIVELQSTFTDLGFLRRNRDGTYSKNTKTIQQWVFEAYSGKPPMTQETNQSKKTRKDRIKQGKIVKPYQSSISIARATLEESGNPALEDFARYGETAAVLTKDVPMLLKGAHEPIHTKWGIAGTCRVTSSKPNIQNPRRSSPKRCLRCGTVYHAIKKECPKCNDRNALSLIGVRECFVPRPGYAFVNIDHTGIELCTLAQQIVKMLGLHNMADRINSGADLHSDVGCLIANMPYDEFRRLYKDGDETISLQRNCGKVYQFGRHGGMGAKTLKYYAKQGYHLDLSLEFCQNLIRLGEIANPDGAEWLRMIDRMFACDAEGRYIVKCFGSNVTRGGCTYSSAANHPFQHLATMIESRVGYEIMREQLTGFTREGKRSPLGECFMVNFIHDEFMHEVPIRLVADVDHRLNYLMTTVPRPLLPDVQVKAECVAMDRWSKKARRIVENGQLQIWKYAA